MKELTPIWQEIWDSLAWNMPSEDKTPIHRFNRLTKEHFPSLKIWLDQDTCLTSEISLSNSEIKKLKYWHRRANPIRLGGRLILFSHQGVKSIVDGNNRVAHYIKNTHKHELDAILIELRQ